MVIFSHVHHADGIGINPAQTAGKDLLALLFFPSSFSFVCLHTSRSAFLFPFEYLSFFCSTLLTVSFDQCVIITFHNAFRNTGVIVSVDWKSNLTNPWCSLFFPSNMENLWSGISSLYNHYYVRYDSKVKCVIWCQSGTIELYYIGKNYMIIAVEIKCDVSIINIVCSSGVRATMSPTSENLYCIWHPNSGTIAMVQRWCNIIS